MHLTSAELPQRMREKLSYEIIGDFKPSRKTADEMIGVLDQAGIQKAYALSEV